jgi:hypothetical protein
VVRVALSAFIGIGCPPRDVEASAAHFLKSVNNDATITESFSMGGPIVRTGTTPEFWANYDQVFGGKKATKKKAAKKKAASKASTKKKATVKKKAAKKKAAKKKKK